MHLQGRLRSRKTTKGFLKTAESFWYQVMIEKIESNYGKVCEKFKGGNCLEDGI